MARECRFHSDETAFNFTENFACVKFVELDPDLKIILLKQYLLTLFPHSELRS